MRAAALAFVLAVVVAGCGSEPRVPGDASARQVLAYAAHAHTLDARVSDAATALLHEHASAGATRLELQELLLQSALLEEDVTSQVPFGAPGRVPTLDAAREVRKAAGFVHSYARGYPAALTFARGHISSAGEALRGAAGALRPHLSAVQAEQLAQLERPPPPPR